MRFWPTNSSVTKPVQCQGEWEIATMLRGAVLWNALGFQRHQALSNHACSKWNKPWLGLDNNAHEHIHTDAQKLNVSNKASFFVCWMRSFFLLYQCTENLGTDSRHNMIKPDSIPCQILQMWRYGGPFSFGVMCFEPTERATEDLKDKHMLDMSEHKMDHKIYLLKTMPN